MKATRCNLCGADNPRVVYVAKDWRYALSDAEWTVVRCKDCGFVYLNPLPDDLGDHYTDQFYYGEATAEQIRQGSMALNAKKMKMLGPRRPGRLLDVGCRTGEFLDAMQSRGWECFGIEVAPVASKKFDVEIRYGTLTEVQFEKQSFDLITFWAVLEHIPNPKENLRVAAGLLRDAGQIVVLVPNFRSWVMGRFYGEDVPRHVVMFEPATLRHMAAEAGLQVDNLTFRSDWGGSVQGCLTYVARRLARHSQDAIMTDWRSRERGRQRRHLSTWGKLKVEGLWSVIHGIDWTLARLADPVLRLLGCSGTAVYYLSRKNIDE